MSSIGGVTSHQLGFTTGEINGSIQNLDKTLNSKLDNFVTKQELEDFGKAQIGVVQNAVKKAVEETAAKFVRPRTSSTISNGSTLVGSTHSSRSNSPVIEDLKQALADVTGKFADVSAKNEALQQEVGGLKNTLNHVTLVMKKQEEGQQETQAKLTETNELIKMQNALLANFLAAQQKN